MSDARQRPNNNLDRQNISAAFSVFEKFVEERPSLTVKPDSRFGLDHARLPQFRIAEWCAVLLASAEDHLHSLRWLSGDPNIEWHPHSTWTTLRATLEISSQVVWLVKPEQQNERLERLLRLVYDDMGQYAEASKLLMRPRDRQKATPEMEKWIANFNLAAQPWSGPSFNRIRTKVNLLECVVDSAAATAAFKPDFAALLWRMAGGYAHGRPWASMHTTYKWEDTPAGDGQKSLVHFIDYGTVSRLLKLVVQTIQVGEWLVSNSCGHYMDVPELALFVEPPE